MEPRYSYNDPQAYVNGRRDQGVEFDYCFTNRRAL